MTSLHFTSQILVLGHNGLFSLLLLFSQAESHKFAHVVVFQYAHRHALPGRDIDGGFHVVGMIRSFAVENDAVFSVPGIIRYAVALDSVTTVLYLPNCFFAEAAAGFMPEPDRRFEFLDVTTPGGFRQRCQ